MKAKKYKRTRQKAKNMSRSKKNRKTSTLGERLLEHLTLRYKDKLALNILKAGLHVHRIIAR